MDLINTKEDCLDNGGVWENSRSTFDNIMGATLTLFEMMTTEGWLTVMYNGMDARGIGIQPKRES
jgi:voltage-dependent calcium channel T type alpha-1G